MPITNHNNAATNNHHDCARCDHDHDFIDFNDIHTHNGDLYHYPAANQLDDRPDNYSAFNPINRTDPTNVGYHDPRAVIHDKLHEWGIHHHHHLRSGHVIVCDPDHCYDTRRWWGPADHTH